MVKLACDAGMSVGGGAAGYRDNAVVSDGRDVNVGGRVARKGIVPSSLGISESSERIPQTASHSRSIFVATL